MNILRIFALCVILMIVGVFKVTAQQQQGAGGEESIDYLWSFVGKVGAGAERHLTTITRDTIMHSGEELKMMVRLQKPMFIYVVHKNSKNEIALLFPYSLDVRSDLEKNNYIPKGRGWFKLDKTTGEETFYIIASTEQQTSLEQKLRTYFDAAAEKRKEFLSGVVDEMKDIKKKHRVYASTAERPISIAGNVRGTKSGTVDIDRIDVATLATEISATNFYSKTITIEHK